MRKKVRKGNKEEGWKKKQEKQRAERKIPEREYNLLEAKPTLLEESYFRYGCCGFSIHFNYHALLLSFLLVFGRCLLFVVDIKGHGMVLLNLIIDMHALFWFHFGIFDSSCKYLMLCPITESDYQRSCSYSLLIPPISSSLIFIMELGFTILFSSVHALFFFTSSFVSGAFGMLSVMFGLAISIGCF